MNKHVLHYLLVVNLCLLGPIARGLDSLHLIEPLPSISKHTMLRPSLSKTKSGKHPSEYTFAITNPTAHQVEAWLAGDYEPLQGLMLEQDVWGNKSDMFADVGQAVSTARGVIAKIEELGAWVDKIDGSSLITLPVGIKKVMGDGTIFKAGINRITLYPLKAEIEIYASVKTPDMAMALFFGSPDIEFTREGGVRVGSLGLLGDFPIPILDGKAELLFKSAIIEGNNFRPLIGNTVKFGCDGLEEFNVDIDLSFSREVIRPQTGGGRVTVKLDVNVADSGEGLNDIVAVADFENKPFYHPQKPDVIWTVGATVFDFSENRNAAPGQLTFPVADGYSPILPDITLWKGVYIEKINLEFTDDLFSENGGIGLGSVEVEDVVIDHNGFTGFLRATELVTIDQGNMDGWPFSVELLELKFHANDLVAFKFEGMVEVPLLDSGTATPESPDGLDYMATFDLAQQQYRLEVSSVNNIVRKSKMLKATFTLYNSSSLSIEYAQGSGFNVVADLTGSIEIDGDYGEEGSIVISVPDFEFQNIVVGNRRPFIKSTGIWAFTGSIGIEVGGFSVTIDAIEFEAGPEPDEAQIKFIAFVNLAEGNVDISAAGGFRAIGVIEEGGDNGRQNWRFDRFKVDMLEVDVTTATFDLYGFVIFFDDLGDYGSGFQGAIDLTIKKVNVGVTAMGLFGNAGNTKYFFVDAMAKFKVPLGQIDLRAIGGGLYVNMAQADFVEDFTDDPDPVEVPANPDADEDAYRAALMQYVGTSLSGVKYVVQPGTFGINANVVVAHSAREEIFNANATLNIQFNSSSGIEHIKITGFANAMSPIVWSGPAMTGVSLAVNLEFFFNEPKFHAAAVVFVDVAGGILRGARGSENVTGFFSGPYNGSMLSGGHTAGGVDILFSPGKWHFNIGVPDGSSAPPSTPIGLKFSLINILSLEVLSYFDIGNDIPSFPGLPDNVASLTGMGNLLRSESQRSSGSGFMFGLNWKMENEINALGIFSAGLILDLGFDIMLQKYQGAVCANNGGNELGINGWYAAGQAWAFIQGYIKVLRFTIFDLSLAAAIQAKGPNPTYGRGAVGGSYRVMGFIKGTCRFPVQFGKQCEFEGGGDLQLDMQLIADLSPADNTNDVPIETKPSVSFFFPIDQVAEADDGEGTSNFVLKLDHFKFLQNGTPVPGTGELDFSGVFFEFSPDDFLAAETEYTVEVKVTIYEANANGNIIGGPIESETRTHTFTTGPGLDYIPEANVLYAYPANGQFNYYQAMSNDNYLVLERGQDELFEELFSNNGGTNTINSTNETIISPGPRLGIKKGGGPSILETPNYMSIAGPAKVIIDNDTETYEVDFSYDAGANTINFSLPSLASGGAYRLRLVFDTGAEEKNLYTMFFRVSRYGTFQEKMTSMQLASMTYTERGNGLLAGDYDAVANSIGEPFGIEEIIGLGEGGPTIKMEADLDNTPWMQSITQFSIPGYGNYNIYTNSACDPSRVLSGQLAYEGLVIDRSELGDLYPTKAVILEQENAGLCTVHGGNYIELHNKRNNPNPIDGVGPAKILYRVNKVVKSDVNSVLYYKLNDPDMYNFFVELEDTSWPKINTECGLCYPPRPPGHVGSWDFHYCLRDQCCAESTEFKNWYFNEFKKLYEEQPAGSCMRLALTLIEPYDCSSQPLKVRPIYNEPGSGNYPIALRYEAPGNSAIQSTVTKNLTY